MTNQNDRDPTPPSFSISTGNENSLLQLSIEANKKQLRQKYIQQRITLSLQQWQEKSDRICEHLLNSHLIKNSQTILSYMSLKQEPDLSKLHSQSQYRWGLPRCQGKNLIWHQYCGDQQLTTGKYGITEPTLQCPIILVEQVDLILVPAVACDRYGNRLGYGGGYYDRLLAPSSPQNIPTIGVIFDFAYVEQLETQPWDQALSYICTESGIAEVQSS